MKLFVCGILKNDTNELICKNRLTVIEKQLMFTKGNGGGRDKSGAWEEYTHTTIYKIDNHQGPMV